MAFSHFLTLLVFALVLARLDLTACQVVKGKVSCLDCTSHNQDLSEIKVSVKCEKVKKLAVASTEEDGSFEVELPRESSLCVAQLEGGPNQLYASRKNRVSLILKDKVKDMYTISKPLAFFTSCPKHTNCKVIDQFASSKTINFPLPPQWGLAPSSYYLPFFPIIGIP